MTMTINTTCQIPIWYLVIGILWSTYQGIRGAIEHRLNYNARLSDESSQPEKKKKIIRWKGWEKWVVLYIHDFAFRFICTISGFLALFIAYSLTFNQLNSNNSESPVLIAFLFLIGIIGIGGQLHYVILLGKLPQY